MRSRFASMEILLIIPAVIFAYASAHALPKMVATMVAIGYNFEVGNGICKEVHANEHII